MDLREALAQALQERIQQTNRVPEEITVSWSELEQIRFLLMANQHDTEPDKKVNWLQEGF